MIKLLQTLSSENLISSAGGSPLKTYLCVRNDKNSAQNNSENYSF